jgi:hypothetical protein
VSDDAHIWYFAYGSNMETATFRGRRGIDFRQALPARAAGWRLVLDKPPIFPIGEGFANLVLDPAATVIGVLYEITAADLAHVELTEGVPLGNYRRADLAVEALAAPGVAIRACTLVADARAPDLRPSRRYMARLVAGALEHGLPEEWVAFLRAVPAGEETPEAAALRPLLDDALRRR